MRKILLLFAAFGIVILAGSPAYAAPSTNGLLGSSSGGSSSSGSSCGETKTQLVACDPGTKTGIGAISDLIRMAISVLTVLIGVVAVGGIAFAAITYATARDNQSQIGQAQTLLRNIVIGLVLYGFTIAIINWLIPGGVIGGGSADASGDGTTQQTTTPSPSTSTNPGTVTPGT